MRRRVTLAIVTAVTLATVASASVSATLVGAQDDGGGDDPLDAIRAAIPEGAPGEFDLTEGDGQFGVLAELVGETTDIAEFGDGSELTGPCGGLAYSYDEDGRLLDAAIDLGDDAPPIDLLDGGQAFTTSNRFKVDTSGLVAYFGFMPRTGEGPRDHSWFVRTSGISLDSGGDPNEAGDNLNAGIVDLAEQLAVKFAANVTVEGELTSDLPTCAGRGHVEFLGPGLGGPIGIVSIGLVGIGVLGLLFNARPAMTSKGTFST